MPGTDCTTHLYSCSGASHRQSFHPPFVPPKEGRVVVAVLCFVARPHPERSVAVQRQERLAVLRGTRLRPHCHRRDLHLDLGGCCCTCCDRRSRSVPSQRRSGPHPGTGVVDVALVSFDDGRATVTTGCAEVPPSGVPAAHGSGQRERGEIATPWWPERSCRGGV